MTWPFPSRSPRGRLQECHLSPLHLSPGPRRWAATVLVPGSPAEAQGWAGWAALGVQAGTGWLSSPACRVTLRTPRPSPHMPRVCATWAGSSPSASLHLLLLQASERKPLPLLCQSLLLHCNESLGLPLCTPSPAMPQALPATACCCLQTLQPGLGWEHLSPRNPKAGNFYLPLQRSRSFLSIPACAGLAKASVGHKQPMGLPV